MLYHYSKQLVTKTKSLSKSLYIMIQDQGSSQEKNLVRVANIRLHFILFSYYFYFNFNFFLIYYFENKG